MMYPSGQDRRTGMFPVLGGGSGGNQTQPVGLGSPPHLQISFMGPFLKTS